MKPSTEPSSGNGSPSLVERLEAAAEGSPELDCRIRCAVEGWRFVEMFDNQPYYYIVERPKRIDLNVSEVPRYTRSLDAALTLVPEGKSWGVGTLMRDELPPRRSFVANCRREGYLGPETPDWDAEAATPYLALCIAALKARLGDVG